MRILVTSNWFPPMITGSAYYAANVAQSLSSRGHEVAVATLDWGAEHVPMQTSYPVHQLPVRRVPKLPIFYNLRDMGFVTWTGARRRLTELVRQFRPHVIHHVNHIFDSTFMTVAVARAANIPIVGSITTPIQHQSPWKQWLLEQADRATVGAFGVKCWDGIVSLDRSIHYYVERVYGARTAKRSRVIPFGVRLERMRDYDDCVAERPGRPQILFVGHIHPFRNPAQLVRAMPLVLEAVPEARCVLAGRVDLKEPVRAAQELGLGEDQVTFLGQTSHSQVVELMQQSHVFANWVTGPYRSLGTAAMEAMLCKLPAINDLPEDLFGDDTLRHDKNIVLMDKRNPRSIAQALIGLLTNEPYRQRIALAGRRFVLETLDWDKVASQMEDLYAHVLQQRGQQFIPGTPATPTTESAERINAEFCGASDDHDTDADTPEHAGSVSGIEEPVRQH